MLAARFWVQCVVRSASPRGTRERSRPGRSGDVPDQAQRRRRALLRDLSRRALRYAGQSAPTSRLVGDRQAVRFDLTRRRQAHPSDPRVQGGPCRYPRPTGYGSAPGLPGSCDADWRGSFRATTRRMRGPFGWVGPPIRTTPKGRLLPIRSHRPDSAASRCRRSWIRSLAPSSRHRQPIPRRKFAANPPTAGHGGVRTCGRSRLPSRSTRPSSSI